MDKNLEILVDAQYGEFIRSIASFLLMESYISDSRDLSFSDAINFAICVDSDAKLRKLILYYTGWSQNLALRLLYIYSSLFDGKQEDGLVMAIEKLLKKIDDCELAANDAISASPQSLTIATALVHGKLQIKEAIELIILEEDLQDSWFGTKPHS